MKTLNMIANELSFGQLYDYALSQDNPPGRKLLEIAFKSFRNNENAQKISGLELVITDPEPKQGNKNSVNVYCIQTDDSLSEELPLLYDTCTCVGTGESVIGLEYLSIAELSRLVISDATLERYIPEVILWLSISNFRSSINDSELE